MAPRSADGWRAVSLESPDPPSRRETVRRLLAGPELLWLRRIPKKTSAGASRDASSKSGLRCRNTIPRGSVRQDLRATNRNGFIRRRGSSFKIEPASLVLRLQRRVRTTSPRLIKLSVARSGCECQLSSEKAMPALLTPIHVPPLGSLGQSTAKSPRSWRRGGSAATREINSSRFIARTKPS